MLVWHFMKLDDSKALYDTSSHSCSDGDIVASAALRQTDRGMAAIQSSATRTSDHHHQAKWQKCFAQGHKSRKIETDTGRELLLSHADCL